MRRFVFGIAAVIGAALALEGQIVRTDRVVRKLASNWMEGRLAGSPGEARAARYIVRRFRKLGLSPYVGEYRHYFFFDAPLRARRSRLMLGDMKVTPTSYRWMAPITTARERHVPVYILPDRFWESFSDADAGGGWRGNIFGSAVVMKTDLPDSVAERLPSNLRSLGSRVEYVASFSPALIILLPPDREAYEHLAAMGRIPSDAPTVLLHPAWRKTLYRAPHVSFSYKLHPITGMGANVVAQIDNGAARYIVFGAHYDHLGRGEYGGSTDPNGLGHIHNGADDNASGVAALLKTAELLRQKDIPWANFLFIAFSGEELGLLGSKALWKDGELDSSALLAMINFDMVGRYDTAKRTFLVGGAQSSPDWQEIIAKANEPYGFNLPMNGRLQGGSDHITFIYHGVPAIHLFTGLHPDYHKPSDDYDKIFAPGIDSVALLAAAIAEHIAAKGKLTYQNPPRPQGGERWRRKVSLRVMPDYTYSGEGFKVEGVIEGGPAHAAGIQAGDVIIQIGDVTIVSIRDYMKALSKYDKGQTVEVVIRRNGETLRRKLTF